MVMEEQQQIPALVRAIRQDPSMANAVVNAPETLVERGFTPRVVAIVSRLVPHLSVHAPTQDMVQRGGWWGY
jgi:hypothetical protein